MRLAVIRRRRLPATRRSASPGLLVLECELPRLGDEVFAKAVVRLLCDAREAGDLVEVTRSEQVRLRPQRDLLVADSPREAYALVDQPLANAEPARRLFDVK